MRNTEPFKSWNKPIHRDAPFAPWNNPMKRNDPFACWNHPFGEGKYKDESESYE